MSVVSSDEVELTIAAIANTVGKDRRGWAQWPGGWPGDIESALVDSVFSARAVYRSARGHGVYERVVSWQERRPRESFTVDALLDEIDSVGVVAWASAFGSAQVSPGRPLTAPHGASKAAAVREAAAALIQVQISTDADITEDSVDAAKKALHGVPGIGDATVNYFLILLGRPGVKPDRMIHRFLNAALRRSLTNREAEDVIERAARQLNVRPHELDHAIWSYESKQARS